MYAVRNNAQAQSSVSEPGKYGPSVLCSHEELNGQGRAQIHLGAIKYLFLDESMPHVLVDEIPDALALFELLPALRSVFWTISGKQVMAGVWYDDWGSDTDSDSLSPGPVDITRWITRTGTDEFVILPAIKIVEVGGIAETLTPSVPRWQWTTKADVRYDLKLSLCPDEFVDEIGFDTILEAYEKTPLRHISLLHWEWNDDCLSAIASFLDERCARNPNLAPRSLDVAISLWESGKVTDAIQEIAALGVDIHVELTRYSDIDWIEDGDEDEDTTIKPLWVTCIDSVKSWSATLDETVDLARDDSKELLRSRHSDHTPLDRTPHAICHQIDLGLAVGEGVLDLPVSKRSEEMRKALQPLAAIIAQMSKPGCDL